MIYERPGAAIVRAVAHRHGLTFADLVGRSQSRKVVIARWEAMHQIHVELKYSTSLIGRVVRRDHTTVIYGLRCFAGQRPPRKRSGKKAICESA